MEEIETTQAGIENLDFEANEPNEVDDIADFEIEFEVQAPPELVLRRSTRLRRPPKRYTLFVDNENFALIVTSDDPSIVNEAINMKDTK